MIDVFEVLVNETWVTGPTITIAMGVETSESNAIRTRMPSTLGEEELMFLSVLDDVLKIVFLSAADRTISLTKNGMSDWFWCQTKVCSRSLQDATFLTSGFLKVLSISTENRTSQGETWIVGRTSCYKYDCSFCPEDIQNFHCLDTAYQLVVVMGGICLILVALLLLLVVLCYGAWMLMWIAKKFGNCFFSTPIGERAGSSTRNFFGMFVPRVSPVVLIMFFCLCAESCDNFYVQQTNLSNCVADPSGLFETCEMVADLQITLPYLGSTSCLTLKDENGEIVTHLEITYETARMELDYALRYFTSSFDIATEQKLRCSGRVFHSGCNSNECRSGDVSRDGEGNFDNILAYEYPGQTFCDLVNVGTLIEQWPHCMFSNNCFYSAFGIQPRGTVYSVSKLIRERISSVLRLNITSASGMIDASISFDENPNVIYGDYTMSFSISGNPVKLDMSSLYLLQSVSNDTAFKAFLSEASDVNQPVAGTVGDIQANVASSLNGERIPSMEEIAYDPSIMMSRTFDDRTVQVSWVFQKPGIKRIATTGGAEIPGTYDGTPIKFVSDNVLWYPLSSAPSAVLSMSGPQVFVTRSTSSVCPSFQILEATGCRSCSRGCDMIISAKSTCLSGTAVVSTKSDEVRITTPVVYLSEDYVNVTVKFTTNQSEPTIDLCLSSTTSECHEITFKTVEVTSGSVVNTTSQIETLVGKDTASDDSWFMFKWIGDMFKGVGKWWQTLLALMFWIAVAIILVLVLWFTFPIWWPLLMWLISKIRGVLSKAGSKIEKMKVKSSEKKEEIIPMKKVDNYDKTMDSVRKRRDVKNVFGWD